VVGSGVLDDKTLIALYSLVLCGLLNSPFTDICPFLVLLVGVVLLGVGGLPSLVPVVGELLKEVRLDGGGLKEEELASPNN
jgi:hypothetical protein